MVEPPTPPSLDFNQILTSFEDYAPAPFTLSRRPAKTAVFSALNDAVDQMSRFSDVVIAGVLLVATLPLMLFVAPAIHCETPGPILRRYGCIGREGRQLEILLFRISTHNPGQIALAWPVRTLTRVGRYLRDTHIDALPQLLNILRGETSLINSAIVSRLGHRYQKF